MLLWCKILVSCVPAAIVGILFNDLFEALFYNYHYRSDHADSVWCCIYRDCRDCHKGKTGEGDILLDGAVL